MKKFLLPLLATAALAMPAAALAHHGHGKHSFRTFVHEHHHALLAKVSGTGASLTAASATLSGSISRSDMLGTGTFASTVTTDWTKANTRTGSRGTLSCAPATAALTLTGASSANTLTSSLTGKTCTWTPTDGTPMSAFFGRGPATGGGSVASLTGTTAKFFAVQRSDGTVKGAVFAGVHEEHELSLFAVGERRAQHEAGDCGGH